MDTASLVFVVDPTGAISATNARYPDFGLDHEPKGIHDLSASEALATEHLGLIAKAHAQSEPVSVRCFLRGRFARVTYRRLSDPNQILAVVTTDIDDPTQAPSKAAAQPTDGSPPLPTQRPATPRARADDLGKLDQLTNREVEVLRLIGRGLSTAQIAATLERSVKTVEWHRVALGTKLSVTNRVELARIAIHAGLCLSAN
jgi:DNA-binding NarL/FixJ family response regulator